MPLVERTATGTWTGDLRTESGALSGLQVTFSSRAEALRGLPARRSGSSLTRSDMPWPSPTS
jgi:hypothetical protein